MTPILNRAILASRHLLTVFYLGLAVALGLYAIRFVWKLWKYAEGLLTVSDSDSLLGLLYLLDSALVAGLVTMVAISSYDSLVSRLAQDEDAKAMEWVGAVDPSNLKIKLAVAIVAISSIHLLQIFLKVRDYTDREITWSLAIHALFLAGVVALAVMDRLEGYGKKAKGGG
ncbi:MAG: YqhA family protein [Acetobacteraceae bacterium]